MLYSKMFFDYTSIKKQNDLFITLSLSLSLSSLSLSFNSLSFSFSLSRFLIVFFRSLAGKFSISLLNLFSLKRNYKFSKLRRAIDRFSSNLPTTLRSRCPFLCTHLPTWTKYPASYPSNRRSTCARRCPSKPKTWSLYSSTLSWMYILPSFLLFCSLDKA